MERKMGPFRSLFARCLGSQATEAVDSSKTCRRERQCKQQPTAFTGSFKAPVGAELWLQLLADVGSERADGSKFALRASSDGNTEAGPCEPWASLFESSDPTVLLEYIGLTGADGPPDGLHLDINLQALLQQSCDEDAFASRSPADLHAAYFDCTAVRLSARFGNSALRSLLRCPTDRHYEHLLAQVLDSDPLLLTVLKDTCVGLLEGAIAGAPGPYQTGGTGARAGAHPIVVQHPITGSSNRVLLPLTVHPVLLRRRPLSERVPVISAHAAGSMLHHAGLQSDRQREAPTSVVVAAVVLRYRLSAGIWVLHEQLGRCLSALAHMPNSVTLLSGDGRQVLYQNTASVAYMGLRQGGDAGDGVGEGHRSGSAADPNGQAGAVGGSGSGLGRDGGGGCVLRELFALSPQQLQEVLREVAASRPWKGIVRVPHLLARGPSDAGADADANSIRIPPGSEHQSQCSGQQGLLQHQHRRRHCQDHHHHHNHCGQHPHDHPEVGSRLEPRLPLGSGTVTAPGLAAAAATAAATAACQPSGRGSGGAGQDSDRLVLHDLLGTGNCPGELLPAQQQPRGGRHQEPQFLDCEVATWQQLTLAALPSRPGSHSCRQPGSAPNQAPEAPLAAVGGTVSIDRSSPPGTATGAATGAAAAQSEPAQAVFSTAWVASLAAALLPQRAAPFAPVPTCGSVSTRPGSRVGALSSPPQSPVWRAAGAAGSGGPGGPSGAECGFLGRGPPSGGSGSPPIGAMAHATWGPAGGVLAPAGGGRSAAQMAVGPAAGPVAVAASPTSVHAAAVRQSYASCTSSGPQSHLQPVIEGVSLLLSTAGPNGLSDLLGGAGGSALLDGSIGERHRPAPAEDGAYGASVRHAGGAGGGRSSRAISVASLHSARSACGLPYRSRTSTGYHSLASGGAAPPDPGYDMAGPYGNAAECSSVPAGGGGGVWSGPFSVQRDMYGRARGYGSGLRHPAVTHSPAAAPRAPSSASIAAAAAAAAGCLHRDPWRRGELSSADGTRPGPPHSARAGTAVGGPNAGLISAYSSMPGRYGRSSSRQPGGSGGGTDEGPMVREAPAPGGGGAVRSLSAWGSFNGRPGGGAGSGGLSHAVRQSIELRRSALGFGFGRQPGGSWENPLSTSTWGLFAVAGGSGGEGEQIRRHTSFGAHVLRATSFQTQHHPGQFPGDGAWATGRPFKSPACSGPGSGPNSARTSRQAAHQGTACGGGGGCSNGALVTVAPVAVAETASTVGSLNAVRRGGTESRTTTAPRPMSGPRLSLSVIEDAGGLGAMSRGCDDSGAAAECGRSIAAATPEVGATTTADAARADVVGSAARGLLASVVDTSCLDADPRDGVPGKLAEAQCRAGCRTRVLAAGTSAQGRTPSATLLPRTPDRHSGGGLPEAAAAAASNVAVQADQAGRDLAGSARSNECGQGAHPPSLTAGTVEISANIWTWVAAERKSSGELAAALGVEKEASREAETASPAAVLDRGAAAAAAAVTVLDGVLLTANAGEAASSGAGAGSTEPTGSTRLSEIAPALTGAAAGKPGKGTAVRSGAMPDLAAPDAAGAAAGVTASVAGAALAGDGAASRSGGLAADEGHWHEVTVTPMATHGSSMLLVMQADVTARVLAERRIAEVLEAEHQLLESIFPRHVLEHAADTARKSLAQQAGAARYSLARLPLARDSASIATYHPMVTILFADIKGFTNLCHQIPATSVMQFLNNLYSRLDTLLDVYGVYKVETIGDCYMVAGGLMTRDADGFMTVRGTDSVDELHAEKTMAFAKAMLREAAQVALPTTGQPVEMRIGLHSGPVMSGIVGSKMPRFCLFGDTVNTASRMESTCPPGCIHVSATTKAHLEDEEWEPTGGVEVKGIGVMNTYHWQDTGEPDRRSSHCLASSAVARPGAVGVRHQAAAAAARRGSAGGPGGGGAGGSTRGRRASTVVILNRGSNGTSAHAAASHFSNSGTAVAAAARDASVHGNGIGDMAGQYGEAAAVPWSDGVSGRGAGGDGGGGVAPPATPGTPPSQVPPTAASAGGQGEAAAEPLGSPAAAGMESPGPRQQPQKPYDPLRFVRLKIKRSTTVLALKGVEAGDADISELRRELSIMSGAQRPPNLEAVAHGTAATHGSAVAHGSALDLESAEAECTGGSAVAVVAECVCGSGI